MELQVGDVLLKKGTAIGAVIIRELTREGEPYSESYSHCGIYAGDGKVYDARYPEIGLYDLDYEVYDIKRVPLTDEEISELLAFCESKKGVHYAVEGVIDEFVERVFHIPVGIDLHDEEWCAIFVNLAFAKLNNPFTYKPYAVPNDIWWSVTGEQLKLS